MSTSYFAKVGADNIVAQVDSILVADLLNMYGPLTEIVPSNKYLADDGSRWIRTWFMAEGDPIKRYNYAAIGDTYDEGRGAFYRPKPYPSWSLNDQMQWRAPVPYPGDGPLYDWNESTLSWFVV